MNTKNLLENSEIESFKSILTLKLISISFYLDDLNTFLQEKVDNSKVVISDLEKREYKGLFPGLVKIVDTILSIKELNTIEKYPKYLFNSSFIYIHSIFESIFTLIGKRAEKLSKNKLKVNNIYESNEIAKVKKYLISNLGIHLDDFKKWNIINDYINIRNLIIHHQATNTKENMTKYNNLKLKLNKHEFITYDNDYDSFYINDIKFLHEYLALISELILLVINKLIEYKSN